MDEETIDVAQLNQATAVAHEYDALMGLCSVGLGVGLLAAAATGQPAVWIALGAAFSAMGTGWYHRRFGFARMRGGRALREGVGAVVALSMLLSAFAMDRLLDPPISLTLLAVAVSLAVGQFLALRRVGLTVVHWTVYAVMVVAAFAPVLGVGTGDLFSPFVLVICGLALVVVGFVDHRRLIRLLGNLPEGLADEQR